MAPSKLLMFFIFSALLVLRIAAEPSLREPEDSTSSLRIELEQLKSKLSFLESSIQKSNIDVQSKDESIALVKKVVQEKLYSIASLQNKIDALLQKGPINAKGHLGQTGESPAWTVELELQVERLKKEIDMQNTKKEALEFRANEAERKMQELNLKLKKLLKVGDEQKTITHRTEQALQLAEEEMIKVNFEASSTSKQSMKDYEGWLPHWLKDHFSHFESYLLTYWNNCGRPALDATVEKVLETIVQVQKHAALCLETVKKTEWMLVMEEKWETFVSYFEPHVESLTAKTFEFYYASKSSLASNFVKVQKVATPLIQEAQMFAEPYINQVDVVTKPYLDKAHVTLKPYTEKIVHSYRRFLKSATLYHNQVQEILKTNEITRPLATMELAWFVATGLLSLPIILMLKFYSANFRKKVKKHSRISRSHHTHCRTKRCHPN